MDNMELETKEIREYIKKILIEEFHVLTLNGEDIDDESNLFEELQNFSSIDALELLVMIEDQYGIEGSYDNVGIEFLQSISSLSEYVYQNINDNMK